MNVHDKEYRSLTLRLGFAVLLMFVLLQVLMTLLSVGSVIFGSWMSEKASNVLYWGLYNVFYFVSFMLPAPFFALISKKCKTEKMFLDIRFPKHFGLMAMAAVGMITAAGQINALLVAPFMGDSGNADILLDLIDRDHPYMLVLVFVMLVIVPPFCEEFLFRGLVLGNLLPYGKGVAIVGSALLFGAMHQNFTQFLYTVVAGVLLGILYTESRSIWPSTIVHLLNNLLSFVQLVIMSRIENELLASRIVICMNLLLVFVGMICMLILISKLKRQKQTPDLPVSAFGTTPDHAAFEKPYPLSAGVAVRGFLSPSIVIFVVLSIGMAVLNLLMEAIL